jgi:hypothetical protein
VCEPEDEEIPEGEQGEVFGSDVEQQIILSPSPHKKLTKRKLEGATLKTGKTHGRKPVVVGHVSREGELFDLNVSSTDEGSANGLPVFKKRGRPRKVLPFELPQAGSSGEGSSPGPPLPKKRGRPRKDATAKEPQAGSSSKQTITKKTVITKSTSTQRRNALKHATASDESGEFFDFGAMSEGTTSDDDGPSVVSPSRVKWKATRGTPAAYKTFTDPSKPLSTPRKRLVPKSPRATKPATPRIRQVSPPRNIHLDARQTTRESFPMMEDPPKTGNENTESDDILPPEEDVLMRAMSSLSVSSPAPSPRPAACSYHPMEVIEISE